MNRSGKTFRKSMLSLSLTIALIMGALPMDGLMMVAMAESPVLAKEADGTLHKSLSADSITVTVPEQTYTGTELTPKITVRDGENILEEDKDYTVGDWSYELVNAGTYFATITGAGDYVGETTAAFTIKKAPLTVSGNDIEIVYGDEPNNAGVNLSGFVNGENEKVLNGNLGYSYEYTQYGDVGNYTITPYGWDAENYEIIFVPGKLTVTQKYLSLTWSKEALIFNGSKQAPTASVDETLNSDAVAVTVSGAQINAGTGYTATATGLTGEKAGNYRLPEHGLTEEFCIGKAAALTLSDYNLDRSNQMRDITASVACLMPDNAGELTYTKGTESIIGGHGSFVDPNWSVDSEGSIYARANLVFGDIITLPVTIGSANYEDSTVKVVVTVINRDDAGVTISGNNTVTYGDPEFTLSANVSDTGENGKWIWDSNRKNVATVDNTGTVNIVAAGTATITARYVSDTTFGSADLKLTVNPKAVPVPEAVTGLKWTGSVQTGVATGEGYSVTGGSTSDVGSYTATATLSSNINYKWIDGTTEPKTIPWSIDKADGPGEPADLSGVAPTTKGGSDGKITGVDDTMEYSVNAVSWTSVSGNTITGLAAGIYHVRIKETETHKAGAEEKVLVPDHDAPKTCTVSFNMGGHGTAVSSQTITIGGKVTKPSDPAAEDCDFGGWFTDAGCTEPYDFTDPVSDDFFLYAKWTAKTYTVSFNMNGKTATDMPQAQQVKEGKCAIAPTVTPKATGLQFIGWFKEAECMNRFDFNSPITADTVIYAGWADEKTQTFTVTFSLNGKPGTAPGAQTVEKNKTATEPGSPVAEGFTFTGWYTESDCKTKYDFTTLVTADITLYAGWEASVTPVIEDDTAGWNLYEDASDHEFKIRGINVNGTVDNINADSKAYYDAKLSGSVITVKVKGDRKKAASKATLEFDLGKAGVVEYVMPVSYVKPSFKLSRTTATIKTGTETVLKTRVLAKNADGGFEPYDMNDVKVTATGLGTVTVASDGSIEIKTQAAGNGKISIKKDSWDGGKTVDLKFNVKGSIKDVLSVDLQGLKTVVVNSNAKGQSFSFDVLFNGTAPSANAVTLTDKKNTNLATVSGDKLTIAYKDGVKNGNYTVTLTAGKAKANVKIKVSGKALDKAVTGKVQTKYDVVTRQSMTVVPKLNDISGVIQAVSVAENGFIAGLDGAGNIVIDYTGDTYHAKNLNIGTLNLSLQISGVEQPVKLTLKKVTAKKTTPKVKVGAVTIPKDAESAEGKVIGTANLVSTYKTGSGTVGLIDPVKTEIVGTPKNVTAKINESDLTEVDITSLTKKSGSVKVRLTYTGGVTKTVTVKVKKK